PNRAPVPDTPAVGPSLSVGCLTGRPRPAALIDGIHFHRNPVARQMILISDRQAWRSPPSGSPWPVPRDVPRAPRLFCATLPARLSARRPRRSPPCPTPTPTSAPASPPPPRR